MQDKSNIKKVRQNCSNSKENNDDDNNNNDNNNNNNKKNDNRNINDWKAND